MDVKVTELLAFNEEILRWRVPSSAESCGSVVGFCDATSTSSTHEQAKSEKKANMAAHVGRALVYLKFMSLDFNYTY